MNMKRGLVFSLCALALAAYGSMATAQTVKVALNLRYNDPADPSEGGTFQLVGKVDSPGTSKGIAAINAYISNINTAGLTYGTGSSALAPTGGGVFNTAVTGGTNVLYGQDTANGPVTLNVGAGAGQVNATDQFKNAAWDNNSVLITGTFGGTRPAFITAGANSSDGNLFAASATATAPEPQNAVVDATTTFTVRGDSVATDGLKSGDANRDNKVDSADFNLLALNFGGTGKTWDQGDFNDSADGKVDSADFNLLALNFGQSRPAPAAAAAVSAVPEPASLGLLAVSALGMFALRRRS
jgi:hypothetical protein